jgi:hypothetical protein
MICARFAQMDGIRDEVSHLDHSLNSCFLTLSRISRNCPKTIAQLILVENLSNNYFGKSYYPIFNEFVFWSWCSSAQIGDSPSCSFDDIFKGGLLDDFDQNRETIFEENHISKLYAISSDITNGPYCLLIESGMTLVQKLKQQFDASSVNNALALTCCACCNVRDYP